MVMDVLGDSQLSITMDLYSHVMPSAFRDAADAMDRALSGRTMIGSLCCQPLLSPLLSKLVRW